MLNYKKVTNFDISRCFFWNCCFYGNVTYVRMHVVMHVISPYQLKLTDFLFIAITWIRINFKVFRLEYSPNYQSCPTCKFLRYLISFTSGVVKKEFWRSFFFYVTSFEIRGLYQPYCNLSSVRLNVSLKCLKP